MNMWQRILVANGTELAQLAVDEAIRRSTTFPL